MRTLVSRYFHSTYCHLLLVEGQSRTKGRLSKRRGTHLLLRKVLRYRKLHLLIVRPVLGIHRCRTATNGGPQTSVDITGPVAEDGDNQVS